MFEVAMSFLTPDNGTDDDRNWAFNLNDYAALAKFQRAMIRALTSLHDVGQKRGETGMKPFSGTDPQDTTLTVVVTEGGAAHHSYNFRWDNLPVEARGYIEGLLDAAVAESGHRGSKQIRKRPRG